MAVEAAALSPLWILLIVKHLLADGPLQTAYQVMNKGTFLHPGGLLHAAIHGCLTAAAVAAWATQLLMASSTVAEEAHHHPLQAIIAVVAPLAGSVGLLDFFVHYMTDFTKMKIDKKLALSKYDAKSGIYVIFQPFRFFNLFLTDQAVHSLTYVAIVHWVVRWLE